MGAEWQIQPEAESFRQDGSSETPVFSFEANSWSTNNGMNCRQEGNSIVCYDIYGNKNEVNQAFRAIMPLAQELGLYYANPAAARVSDNQPYYPQGTYAIAAGQSQEQPVQPYIPAAADPYSYYQNDQTAQPLPTGPVIPPGGFDPYSYHPGDKNPVVQPPVFTDLPVPLPLPPVNQPEPRPGDKPPLTQPEPRPEPKPTVNQPRPNSPCRPCRPCRPNGGWYPGKVVGQVFRGVFGGRRCR